MQINHPACDLVTHTHNIICLTTNRRTTHTNTHLATPLRNQQKSKENTASEVTGARGREDAYRGPKLTIKAREMIGTSVRTMVNVQVTTDGDQHQDEGECGYRNIGERTTTTSVQGQGVKR